MILPKNRLFFRSLFPILIGGMVAVASGCADSSANKSDRIATTAPTAAPTAAPTKPPFIKDVEAEALKNLIGIGVKNPTISCPTNITAEDVGKTFDCQVKSNQGNFGYEVSYRSKLDVGFRAKGLVMLSPLETSMQILVKEKKNIDATVNCDAANSAVWVPKKIGDTRECSVTDTSGGITTAIAKTTSEYDDVSIVLKN